jgi:hypothetical protein
MKLITILIFNLSFIFSQDFIIPESDVIPILDGKDLENEWLDASSFNFKLSDLDYNIKLKHNSDSLFVMFSGAMGSRNNGFFFPELLFDMGFEKANQYDINDFWFHVSATDCFDKGVYGSFSNCDTDGTMWRANPNWTMELLPDTVEFAISLEMLFDGDAKFNELFGFTFGLSNTQFYWEFLEDAQETNPSTWQSAILEKKTNNLPILKENTIYDVFNTMGELISEKITKNEINTLDQGLYLLKSNENIIKYYKY